MPSVLLEEVEVYQILEVCVDSMVVKSTVRKGSCCSDRGPKSLDGQEDLTMKCKKYACTGFSEYVIVHREGVGDETKGCVILRFLEPFREQAVDEMVGSGTEVLKERRFRRGRTKKSAKVFYYRKCFVRMKLWNVL